MIVKKPHILSCLLIILMMNNCVEPFEAATQTFESVLVIDARLSDELKKHEVLLSRARPFEKDTNIVESNASVQILDTDGTSYDFEEVEPGKYRSLIEFNAKPQHAYQLLVTSKSGESYESDTVTTPEKATIKEVYVETGTNEFSEGGVGVYLDNEANGAAYFRYEYEETYKIIAPSYDPFEFEIIDDIACEDGDAFEVGVRPRLEQQRVCFGTNTSKAIIQTATDLLTNNNLSRFLVRFISKEDFIISHRYSILVKQHVQTSESYSYFQDLEDFSSSDNVFSEIQPGFLEGNIKSNSNTSERVIGYFQVTSVSNKRLYFNFADLFPDEPLPEYPINCNNTSNPRLIPASYHCTMGSSGECDGNCTSPLIQAIKANLVVFSGEVEGEDFDSFVAPYYTKPRACGDCTLFGSTITPDFWIE